MTYPVFYRKSGPPGASKGPVIWIREDMRGVEHIIQHEVTHVLQWFTISMLGLVWVAGCYRLGVSHYANIGLIALILHPLLYATLPAFKLQCEVQAYRAQIKYGGELESCALSLSRDYGLKLSQAEALALLT